MRMGMRADADWQYVGALLAQANSDDQVAFFRAFVRECESWGTRLQVEQQLAFVNRMLTSRERETLSMIGYEDDGADA